MFWCGRQVEAVPFSFSASRDFLGLGPCLRSQQGLDLDLGRCGQPFGPPKQCRPKNRLLALGWHEVQESHESHLLERLAEQLHVPGICESLKLNWHMPSRLAFLAQTRLCTRCLGQDRKTGKAPLSGQKTAQFPRRSSRGSSLQKSHNFRCCGR